MLGGMILPQRGCSRRTMGKIGLAVACLALLFPVAGHAAEITPYAEGRLQYDDNLFRTANGVSAPDGQSPKDWSYVALAGLAAEAESGDLEARATGSASRNWYSRNSYLDFTGYSLAGVVKKTGPSVGISLKAQQERRLSSFSDVRIANRNIQTLTLLNAEASATIVSDWRVVAGGSLTRSVNSAASISSSDYRRLGLRLGFGYYSPLNNIVALQFTHSTGRGMNDSLVAVNGVNLPYRQDYTENGADLVLQYTPSVASNLQAQIGYVDRKDRSIFNNGYSGLVAQATFGWNPRDTLQFTLDAGRRLESESYIYSDAVRVNYVNFGAEGELNPAITLKAGLQFTRQRFSYDVEAPVPLAARTENLKIASAAIIYKPVDRYAVTLEAFREMRSSNQTSYRYDANTVRLTGKVSFGASAKKTGQ